MDKQIVSTPDAPMAIGPYSQAVVCNGMVFTSGQLGIHPASGQFPSDSAAEQAEQALKNLMAVLKAAGTGPENVIKTTVFVRDMNDFAAINAVYAKYFPEPFPARSCVQVAALPKDAAVEIEAIARQD